MHHTSPLRLPTLTLAEKYYGSAKQHLDTHELARHHSWISWLAVDEDRPKPPPVRSFSFEEIKDMELIPPPLFSTPTKSHFDGSISGTPPPSVIDSQESFGPAETLPFRRFYENLDELALMLQSYVREIRALRNQGENSPPFYRSRPAGLTSSNTNFFTPSPTGWGEYLSCETNSGESTHSTQKGRRACWRHERFNPARYEELCSKALAELKLQGG